MSGVLSSPQEIVETALAAATTEGTVVLVTDRSEANLRWANSSLTTNGEMSSRSVTVIATTDNGSGARAGVVGRTVTDAEAVRELVAQAEAAARAAEPAPDAAPLVTPEQAGVGSDFALQPETTTVAAFTQVAADLGEAFAAGGAKRQHFGFAEQMVDSVYLGTSTGLRLRHVQPTGRLEMNVKNADWSSSSYLAFSLRDPAEADVAAADAELGRRLGWAERQIALPAGRYETILPPTTLADLLVEAYWESGARAADEGRSAYSGKLGERLSRLPLDLFSDPARRGLESAPFVIASASTSDTSVFDNGLPLPRQDVIAKGELVSLTGSRAYAAAHDTPVRLECDNLVLEAPGATANLDDLVAGTSRGLLLSTLWYIRVVDPQTLLLTGLTRDGVYLVEDGEVVGAVNNFRWNESPLDVLDRISEAGATERCYPREWGDWFTRAAMPPVRVSDFNMSSVSVAQ
jgi:predicted Zn-dependent protease